MLPSTRPPSIVKPQNQTMLLAGPKPLSSRRIPKKPKVDKLKKVSQQSLKTAAPPAVKTKKTKRPIPIIKA